MASADWASSSTWFLQQQNANIWRLPQVSCQPLPVDGLSFCTFPECCYTEPLVGLLANSSPADAKSSESGGACSRTAWVGSPRGCAAASSPGPHATTTPPASWGNTRAAPLPRSPASLRWRWTWSWEPRASWGWGWAAGDNPRAEEGAVAWVSSWSASPWRASLPPAASRTVGSPAPGCEEEAPGKLLQLWAPSLVWLAACCFWKNWTL